MTKRLWQVLCALLVSTAPLVEAQRERTPEPRNVTPRGALTEAERSVVSLFEAAAPSVAYITTESVQRTFFGPHVSQGSGSAFVWDARGNIVTNHHVVANAERVLVQLETGKEPLVAEYVGGAPEYDLAVVRVRNMPAGVKPIPLGSSKDLRVGQSVYAIGNPFGLSRTLTTGIISALDRYLPTDEYAEIAGVIQTDAAINPGNSGGPLLDSAGRLIGVNTAIRSASGSSAGVSFAIPVDMVNRIVPQLIARGRASTPGIGIRAIDPARVARAGIKGVVLGEIVRNSPAAEARLKPFNARTNEIHDVIVAVNGRGVETLSTFVAELDRVGIGNTAEITVQRFSEEKRERKERLRVIDTRARE